MDVEKYRLTPEEIYVAAQTGFMRKVDATNLTDEIELKRHEGAREVANDATDKVLRIQAEEILEATPEKVREELRKLFYPQNTGTFSSDYAYDRKVEAFIPQILSVVQPLIEQAKREGKAEVLKEIRNIMKESPDLKSLEKDIADWLGRSLQDKES